MLQLALCDEHEERLQKTAADVIALLPPDLVEIDVFPKPSLLLDRIEHDAYRPDLSLLDTSLTEYTCSALSSRINRLLPDCRIIFVRSFRGDALSESSMEQTWFSLQRSSVRSLAPLLNSTLSRLLPGNGKSLLLSFKGRTLVVPVEEVLYLVREGRKTRVVCEEMSHLVSQSPAKLIPASLSQQLARCHQGYWVNFAKVQTLEKNEFVLAEGARIPISRSLRRQALRSFSAFHGRG